MGTKIDAAVNGLTELVAVSEGKASKSHAVSQDGEKRGVDADSMPYMVREVCVCVFLIAFISLQLYAIVSL